MRTHSFALAAALPLALIALGVGLSACKSEQQPEGPPPLPGGAQVKGDVEKTREAGAGKKIAVVPKGTAHSFWKAVEAGAKAAGKEFGCEILWKGPETETQVDRQIEIIRNFVTQKVDAIVMAACDASALVPELKKAKEAGITIVTIDSGIDDETIPVSFVATDNVAAAKQAGELLAKAIGEKGKVGLIPFDPSAQSSQDRENGFKEGIKKYTNVKLEAVLYSKSDPTEAVKVTENMLNATPDIVGIFAANEPAGVGAAQVIKERGLSGKVRLVAFDGSEPEVKALRDGIIDALVVQDPFKMGYQGVECAIKAMAGQKPAARMPTDAVVVTRDNVDSPEIQKVLNPPTE